MSSSGTNRSGGGIASAHGGRSAPTSDDVRAVRRRWASGVAVVTTHDGDGFRGATVSAFAWVSLEPPVVLVCLEKSGRMSELAPESGVFAVSILDRGAEFLSERFAGRAPLPDSAFTGIAFDLNSSGCPVLRESHAWISARVSAVHTGGDHTIVVGDVEEFGVGQDTDDPLLSYDGRYRGIEPA